MAIHGPSMAHRSGGFTVSPKLEPFPCGESSTALLAASQRKGSEALGQLRPRTMGD